MNKPRPRTSMPAPAPEQAPPPAPVAAAVPPRPELVRVLTLIPHEGHYRDDVDTVILTRRVQGLIAGGVLRLLGPAPAPDPPTVTIIHPPAR